MRRGRFTQEPIVEMIDETTVEIYGKIISMKDTRLLKKVYKERKRVKSMTEIRELTSNREERKKL